MPDEKKTTKKPVTLAFVNPMYNAWDFGVAGVDEITKEGTEVPASKEKEVRAAAEKRGVELKKI